MFTLGDVVGAGSGVDMVSRGGVYCVEKLLWEASSVWRSVKKAKQHFREIRCFYTILTDVLLAHHRVRPT